jgi:hypothetical protein
MKDAKVLFSGFRSPERRVGGPRWKRHGNDRVKPDENFAAIESR